LFNRPIWLAGSPDILFQIFSGDKLAQIKEQLRDLESILKLKHNHEVVKVKNGSIYKLIKPHHLQERATEKG